jgi:hypothetical protein
MIEHLKRIVTAPFSFRATIRSCFCVGRRHRPAAILRQIQENLNEAVPGRP